MGSAVPAGDATQKAGNVEWRGVVARTAAELETRTRGSTYPAVPGHHVRTFLSRRSGRKEPRARRWAMRWVRPRRWLIVDES
jgi:hypothetical protein